MRLPVAVFGSLFAIAVSLPALAVNAPSCDRRILTRQGNQVSMSLQALTARFNQRLKAAHSGFTNLRLTPEGTDELKVSGEKDGSPMSISGPLQVTDNGQIQLHAKHIEKNGSGVKGMMDLFGKKLEDYVDPKSGSLSVDNDNLLINPDRLLGLRGQITNVQLHNSRIQMEFATQPCR